MTKPLRFTIIICICLWGIFGCNWETKAIAQTRKYVIVLVDKTRSFTQEGVLIWDKAIRQVADVIVPSLDRCDTFVLIEIDEHGGEAVDIRINRTLPSNQLLMIYERKKLQHQVLGFQRDSDPQRTDIIGALSYAAYLLKNTMEYENNLRGVIFVFSDMEQNYFSPQNSHRSLKKEAEIRNLTFPPVRVHFFHYRGVEYENTLSQTWGPVFNNANLPDANWRFYNDTIPFNDKAIKKMMK